MMMSYRTFRAMGASRLEAFVHSQLGPFFFGLFVGFGIGSLVVWVVL